MNQLISNVLMQPKPDAVEGPQALIEKLEHLEKEFLNKERDNTSGIMTLIASATASGVSKAINIVKQHEAESEVQDAT